MDAIEQRYRRNAAAFADTVRNVPADAWNNPSPCPDWDARAVVAHVVDSQAMFEKQVGRELADVPSVDDDPLGAFESASSQVADHLADPATAGTEYDGPFGTSTFATSVDRYLSFDLVVHRWDLATACGLDATMTQQEIDEAREGVKAFGDAMRSPGAFGAEVTAPPDADEQTKLLAFLGRRA